MSNNNNQSISLLTADVQPYDIIFNIITFFIISPIGVAANIFILVIISRHKTLQSRCFLLIAGECICSAALPLQKIAEVAEETAQFLGKISLDRDRLLCYLTKSLLGAWSCETSSLVIVAISLNRLISILKPTKYQHIGKRYAFTCVSVCFLFGAITALRSV